MGKKILRETRRPAPKVTAVRNPGSVKTIGYTIDCKGPGLVNFYVYWGVGL